ncbi:endonuclease/exonuclease/phosphatase family protein [Loktanella sp. R86503]|uniref:endonuclease/exonuclease/phosphatase family protein n=1 Tax=Loktanella sp. R86503 TaxID=3093847 RepID=UPI0036D88925
MTDQSDLLHVVSYNIRKAMGTDRRRDPHRILTILRETAPDIAILQEADLRLGQRPTALPRDAIEDAGFVPAALAENTVSLGWHGNAILIRPDWPVLSIDRIVLPGLEPRGAVAAVVDSSFGPLRIVGLHLGLLRRSRLGQQHAVLDWMADQVDHPTIIAGDLNEWSARRGLGPLTRKFGLRSPGHSFHARWRLAPLDRIGMSDHFEMDDLDMIDTDLSRMASDHLPLSAKIAMRRRP